MIKSLYIHIPFCNQKCYYCDFTSFSKENPEYEKYVDVLIKDLEYKKKEYFLSKLDTIYIGGGTPTVLPLSLLEKLLFYIKENFHFSTNYEYTIEGNPESIDKEKLLVMRKYGINRLSMGVQSFNEDILKYLGRIHNSEQSVKAFYEARSAGFSNINIDLIYGIPGESFQSWQKTLESGISLSPDHVSLYQLKIEEGTILHQKLCNNEIQLFPDDLGEKIYEWNLSYLREKSYVNYEFSNFAKNNLFSRHNLNYWNYRPYAAAGFGGIGFYGKYRSEFAGNFREYISLITFGEENFLQERLTKEEQISEYIIMNLRKSDGFSIDEFNTRFNVSFLKIYGKQVEKLKDEKFLELNADKVSLTLRGRLLSNLVLEEFV